MKKSDLKQGMLIQTTHNRYGFVELDRNRIDICYDPDLFRDEDRVVEKLSLDEVFEFGDNQLGIGSIVTESMRKEYPDVYGEYEVGELIIWYEIIAAYTWNKVYDNGEGPYPPLKLQ